MTQIRIIRRSVIWSALDYAAVPVGMLMATPILIRYLGLEQFGLLVLVTALISIGAMFNFGFGDTALKFVSHYNKLGDSRRAQLVIRTISALTLCAGVMVSAAFSLSIPVITSILNISSLPSVAETLQVTAFIIPLRLLESVYVSALRSNDRYDIASAVTVTAKLINIALQIGLAISGYALPQLLLATAMVSLASVLALVYASFRNFGNVTPNFTLSIFNEIRHYSVWSWTQGIAGLVYANIDRLLIPVFMTPSALGVYGVCIQIAQNIHSSIAASSHVVFPRMSKLSASAHFLHDPGRDEVRALFIHASRIVTVMAVTLGAFVAVFSYQILELWVGPDLAEKGHVLLAVLAIAYSWFAASSIVTYYTLNGLGFAKFQAGISAASAGIMAVSCSILIPSIGLVGAAVARLPDVFFRLGVRMHLCESVLHGVPKWISADFLRVTVIAGLSAYLLQSILGYCLAEAGFFSYLLGAVVLVGGYSVAVIGSNWIEKKMAGQLSEDDLSGRGVKQ